MFGKFEYKPNIVDLKELVSLAEQFGMNLNIVYQRNKSEHMPVIVISESTDGRTSIERALEILKRENVSLVCLRDVESVTKEKNYYLSFGCQGVFYQFETLFRA
ncbi:hypothetical protein [Deinococcus ficus]|uniref:hypothetical protein n=1 Tax=Deinococcus ficus TaxID=317577 RepID=UPI00131D5769|nr:hypothetical protein [Deinococcus ficus]